MPSCRAIHPQHLDVCLPLHHCAQGQQKLDTGDRHAGGMEGCHSVPPVTMLRPWGCAEMKWPRSDAATASVRFSRLCSSSFRSTRNTCNKKLLSLLLILLSHLPLSLLITREEDINRWQLCKSSSHPQCHDSLAHGDSSITFLYLLQVATALQCPYSLLCQERHHRTLLCQTHIKE